MRIPVMIAISLLALAPAGAMAASEQSQIGMLNCTVEGGTGFIVGSKKMLTCVFDRADGGPDESYAGEIKKFGIDIGETKVSRLTWAVFAVAAPAGAPGKLSGTYGGITGEATVGVGLGANILVGGFENSVALQPVSVQAQEGLNIAAGIANLELQLQ